MQKTYKIHPSALILPRISKAEFDELKEDIQAHGIRVPVLVNKNKTMILDGRNRIMAAHDLKLKDSAVPIEIFDGSEEEATGEIISRNIMRRHLTDDQRVSLLAKLLGPELTKAAAERKTAGHAGTLGLKSTQGRTRELVAAEADVSQHKARAALTTAKFAPKELDKVIAGKEKLAEAKRKRVRKLARQQSPSRRKVCASG